MLCCQIVIKNYRIIYQAIGEVVIFHGIIDGPRNIQETMYQRVLILKKQGWKNYFIKFLIAKASI